MKRHIVRMKQLLAERDARFLVVLYPWNVQLRFNRTELHPQIDMLKHLSEHGIGCLDLFDAFRRSGDKNLFFEDGVHPTATGQRIAAREILKQMAKMDIRPTEDRHPATL